MYEIQSMQHAIIPAIEVMQKTCRIKSKRKYMEAADILEGKKITRFYTTSETKAA